MIQSNAVSHGEFELVSGTKSSYYIDFSRVSLTHLGQVVVGRLIMDACKGLGMTAIGGPVLGACPLVCATLLQMPGVRGFFIRKEEKGHAKKDLIEGPIKEGENVVLVEDVTTSGHSVLAAANIVRDVYHCEVLKILTMVDRQAGAEELLTDEGYEFEWFANLEDLEIS